MARTSATRRKLPTKTTAAPVVETPEETIPDLVNDADETIATADDTTTPDVVETVAETPADELAGQGEGNLPEAPIEGATPDVVPAADPVAEAPVKAAAKGRLTEADLKRSEYRKHYQEILDSSGVSAPDGQILFPLEPLTFTTADVHKDFIILTEDVYRMVVPFRSKRPTFTLVALAGTRIDDPQVMTKADYARVTGELLGDATFE